MKKTLVQAQLDDAHKKRDLTQSMRILGLLEEKHKNTLRREEWLFWKEFYVGEDRTIDAFAINCWRSKNFRRVAYEVKVSRADFMNEIKDHTKRQPAIEISNEFYFVTLPGLVAVNEIPDICGLIEAQADGLKVRKVAKFREQPDTIPINAMIRPLRELQNGWSDVKDYHLWRYAGRDLTREDLLKLIAEEMPAEMVIEIERKADEKFKEWKGKKEEYQLAKVILDEMGTSFNASPERVREWLRDQRQGIPLNEIKQLPYHLKQLLEIWTEKIEPKMAERENQKEAAKKETTPDGP